MVHWEKYRYWSVELPNTVVLPEISHVFLAADRARNRKVAVSIHARGPIVVFFATATIVYSSV